MIRTVGLHGFQKSGGSFARLFVLNHGAQNIVKKAARHRHALERINLGDFSGLEQLNCLPGVISGFGIPARVTRQRVLVTSFSEDGQREKNIPDRTLPAVLRARKLLHNPLRRTLHIARPHASRARIQ